MNPRLSVRLPEHFRKKLADIALVAGYSSPSQLARAVLVQFLRNRESMARASTALTDWMDEFDMFAEASRHDPTQFSNINNRN